MLLYIDGEVEDDSNLELVVDNVADIVKIGVTCEGYPPNQPFFSGAIYSLVYYPNSSYNDLVAGAGMDRGRV